MDDFKRHKEERKANTPEFIQTKLKEHLAKEYQEYHTLLNNIDQKIKEIQGRDKDLIFAIKTAKRVIKTEEFLKQEEGKSNTLMATFAKDLVLSVFTKKTDPYKCLKDFTNNIITTVKNLWDNEI